MGSHSRNFFLSRSTLRNVNIRSQTFLPGLKWSLQPVFPEHISDSSSSLEGGHRQWGPPGPLDHGRQHGEGVDKDGQNSDGYHLQQTNPAFMFKCQEDTKRWMPKLDLRFSADIW